MIAKIDLKVVIVLLAAGVLVATPTDSRAARQIEEMTEQVREAAAGSEANPQGKVAALEDAIKAGERASADLRNQIQSLENEKQALEKVQAVLASGLIGALVTAIVAILGAVLGYSRGRADRDLKRLEVLEKSAELEAKGLKIPEDIKATYVARTSV